MAQKQKEDDYGYTVRRPELKPKHILCVYDECMKAVLESGLFKPAKKVKIGRNKWQIYPSTEQISTAKWMTDWLLTERKG